MIVWVLLLGMVGADAPDIYDRVLQYRRDHVEVRPLAQTQWVTPLSVSADGANFTDNNAGLNAMPRMAPMPAVPESWGIVRGAAEVLDDADFARLLQDKALLARIEAERFWPRVGWSAGFGVVSAASLGSGAYFTWGDHGGPVDGSDGRAIGISLLAVGVASGLLAVIFPTYADHVLTAHDAAQRCDVYNAQLREHLDLHPEDLQRF